jgi:hypothetical protein
MSIILSIITELFPDIGLSYYYPPTKSIQFYDKQEPLRWLIVAIVWIPIILALFKISKLYTLIATSFILFSFYINRNSTYKEKFGNIGYLHLIGFVIIYNIIQNGENNTKKFLYLLYILSLLIGGSLMGANRGKNLSIDIIGRLLFSYGFYNFVTILI